MTLYRLIKFIFVILALALLWSAMHPDATGLAPDAPPEVNDTHMAWAHVNNVVTHPPHTRVWWAAPKGQS